MQFECCIIFEIWNFGDELLLIKFFGQWKLVLPLSKYESRTAVLNDDSLFFLLLKISLNTCKHHLLHNYRISSFNYICSIYKKICENE